MSAAAVTNRDVVVWVCFAVGVLVLLAGVVIGLWQSFKRAPRSARGQVEKAKSMVEETKRTALSEGAGGEALPGAADAAAEEAKSAIEQVGSIVGSLPEDLRFAGTLVLVGTVLMGVATVQFGGVSLF